MVQKKQPTRDFYRTRGRDPDGELILRERLKVVPKSAVLHHALGLALARMKRGHEELGELERAIVIELGNARFCLCLCGGAALDGQSDCSDRQTRKALLSHPNNGNILSALAVSTARVVETRKQENMSIVCGRSMK